MKRRAKNLRLYQSTPPDSSNICIAPVQTTFIPINLEIKIMMKDRCHQQQYTESVFLRIISNTAPKTEVLITKFLNNSESTFLSTLSIPTYLYALL